MSASPKGPSALFRAFAAASRRRALQFAAAQGGSTAIEFAFTVPIFITLAIGILYVGLTYLAKQHLETVAENAAYNVMVNNTSTTGTTQAAFQTYICGNLSGIFDCSKVMVDLRAQSAMGGTPYPTFTYDVNGNVTNSWAYQPVAVPTVMILRVMYPWPAISLPFGVSFGNMGNGSMLIMSCQVFETETP